MTPQKSLYLGPFEIYSIEAGRFLLDGGAMFGVVPKTLWSRQIPADDKNRIKMAMRLMLIRSSESGRLYLIDTGSGNKFNDKLSSIYGLDYQHSELINSLNNAGYNTEEVTDIVFSHLHFDHCGGTTTYDQKGNLKEVFPNATYHVNERHWRTANHPNEREKASFFPDNINPIKESGRLNLVQDHHEFEPGLTTMPMDGHTDGQQLPLITHGDTTIVYVADLIPTAAHVPLPWVMGYDMKPIQTLEEKALFLKRASNESWYLFLEHDPSNEVITVKQENGKFQMNQSISLIDIT